MSDYDETEIPVDRSFEPYRGGWWASDAKMRQQALARQAETDEIMALNRKTLFTALAEQEVAVATLTYTGFGDEGEFDEACFYKADNTPLDAERIGAMPVTYYQYNFELPAGQQSHNSHYGEGQGTIGGLMEDIGSYELERRRPGWETNEGAYGKFTFHVPEQDITLRHAEGEMRYFVSEASLYGGHGDPELLAPGPDVDPDAWSSSDEDD